LQIRRVEHVWNQQMFSTVKWCKVCLYEDRQDGIAGSKTLQKTSETPHDFQPNRERLKASLSPSKYRILNA